MPPSRADCGLPEDAVVFCAFNNPEKFNRTAFDAWMLYPGWKRGVTDPKLVKIQDAADHIDHICQLAGSTRHCAIGSDLDGGFGTEQTPGDLDTITDLHKLESILESRGYSPSDVDAIFFGNWLRFFTASFPA